LRNFTIHIDMQDNARLHPEQMEQLSVITSKLFNYMITFHWIVHTACITSTDILRILNVLNKYCGNKGMVIHNVLQNTNNKATPIGKLLAKKFHFTFAAEDEYKKDITSIRFGNSPSGCNFKSCLGKTIYIKNDGTLGMCPYVATDILLHPLGKEDPLDSLFDTLDFKATLSRSIQKRDDCKKDCEYFNLCRSGCVFQEKWHTKGCPISQAIKACVFTEAEEETQNLLHLANYYKG
jgi:radical SAM protein with 4Fe4S-binding SPASM domain